MSITLHLARTSAFRRRAMGYVRTHPQARLAHEVGWSRGLWEAHHLPSVTIVALQERRVVGVAPWTFMANRGRGLHLELGPYAPHAAVLADSSAIERGLLQGTRHMCRMLPVSGALWRVASKPIVHPGVVADGSWGATGQDVFEISIEADDGASRSRPGPLTQDGRDFLSMARKHGVAPRPVQVWRPIQRPTPGDPTSAPRGRLLEVLHREVGVRLAAWAAHCDGRQVGYAAAAARGHLLQCLAWSLAPGSSIDLVQAVLLDAMLRHGRALGLRLLEVDAGRGDRFADLLRQIVCPRSLSVAAVRERWWSWRAVDVGIM